MPRKVAWRTGAGVSGHAGECSQNLPSHCENFPLVTGFSPFFVPGQWNWITFSISANTIVIDGFEFAFPCQTPDLPYNGGTPDLPGGTFFYSQIQIWVGKTIDFRLAANILLFVPTETIY